MQTKPLTHKQHTCLEERDKVIQTDGNSSSTVKEEETNAGRYHNKFHLFSLKHDMRLIHTME